MPLSTSPHENGAPCELEREGVVLNLFHFPLS